jgi:hypothetical protein
MNICIPKVNSEHLNKHYIFNAFSRLKLGSISNIVIHGNGCVFIYFSEWHNAEIKQKLLNEENIYVIHDQQWGWFWKCCLLKVKHISKVI